VIEAPPSQKLDQRSMPFAVMKSDEDKRTKTAPGDTFKTIEAKLPDLETTDFRSFFGWLLGELQEIKEGNDHYYHNLRSSGACWITWSRRILATLGAAALLLTAFGSALTFVPPDSTSFWSPANKWALLAAMSLYAIMGAIALYERGTDRTSSYFRHLAVGIAIRNLWNKFQLTLLKEYPGLASAADPAASRQRAVALAEALCNDMEKLVTNEQTEWRTEFFKSLDELEHTASKGLADVKVQLEEFAKSAAKAAEAATAAAERAEAATKPGHLNLVVSGQFDGELVVLVDGVEKVRAISKKMAIEHIRPGIHKLSVRAKHGANQLDISEMLDVKPGIQDHTISIA
jgi:hypothetical protein